MADEIVSPSRGNYFLQAMKPCRNKRAVSSRGRQPEEPTMTIRRAAAAAVFAVSLRGLDLPRAMAMADINGFIE